MGINKIDENLCNGCKLCFDYCPVDVIGFDSKMEKAFIAYPEDCAICFQCVDACPVNAVSVSSISPRISP